MMSSSEIRGRFPFTASQWQELEHQALIFKYIISGMPIPPDLLLSLKRSLDLTLSNSKLFPHHAQQYGWNCLQMGLGRKIDPEPGRCRRTDGKKWRCSKEAYPDSKYCERHMHRGKNRSRKPVESAVMTPPNYINSSSSINKTTSSSSNLFTNSNLSSLSSTTSDTQNHHPCFHNSQIHPSYYSQSSTSRAPEYGLSSQDNNTTHLLFDSASYAQNAPEYRDRYVNGLKEDVDEHLFFSEASGTVRSFSGSSMDDSCQLTPLTMSNTSSLSNSKHRSYSEMQNGYSTYSKLDTAKHYKQDQHSYVMGSEMPWKIERDDEPQMTIHRFFDEGPPKNRDSWLNLDDNSSNCSSLSTTQLSISVPPSSSHVFPIFNSRSHHDG